MDTSNDKLRKLGRRMNRGQGYTKENLEREN